MLSLAVLNDDTTGVVLYEGISSIDQKPIVAIATLKTSNTKTGNLIQTWIMRQDINPMQAIKSNEDYSVCDNLVNPNF